MSDQIGVIKLSEGYKIQAPSVMGQSVTFDPVTVLIPTHPL